jgi:hypothetical protein
MKKKNKKEVLKLNTRIKHLNNKNKHNIIK